MLVKVHGSNKVMSESMAIDQDISQWLYKWWHKGRLKESTP